MFPADHPVLAYGTVLQLGVSVTSLPGSNDLNKSFIHINHGNIGVVKTITVRYKACSFC